MEGRTKMKSNRGFTLIELAVVLAVIAVLAAILTPLVTSYIDQARITRAQTDVRAIAQSFQLHKRDTNEYPIFTSSTYASADATDFDYLASSGTLPSTSGAGWNNLSTAGSIDDFLNQNQQSVAEGDVRGGAVAYRGPYLDQVPSDPWGFAYVVSTTSLLDGATQIAFVVSGGPDGDVETDETLTTTGAFATSGDDVAARIR